MMVGRNLALTLIAGLAFAAIVLEYPPADWTQKFKPWDLCLMVLGFILWTVARFQLGHSLTVSAQAKRLVTRGLYSRIRNPIYVFASCVLAGLMLALGRPLWLLIFVVVIPLQIWGAGNQSQGLAAKLGEEYRKYRSATWF
jgi:protein-S-isoprenylcysteine O-methyltransferase Ste14